MTAPFTVALAGNPNVGKSTVFNALTGLRQHTGNWPGKTVETARGRFSTARRDYALVDLPGTYSLAARSEEERVARDYLAAGDYDAAVVVCDATCLRRSLTLALQVLELTPNVLVCVNLLDEAESRRIQIDIKLLSDLLGVPVVGVTAQRKRSLRALTDALDAFQPRPAPLLPPPEEGLAVRLRAERATALCAQAVRSPEATDARDRRLDRLLTGRVTGWAVMVGLLALVLWLTISGANVISDALGAVLFRLGGALSGALTALGAPEWLRGALVDGVYRVLAWVVSVMLPPMAIFFPLFTLLEDLGYLPRVAFALDQPFQRCGACGKQALTMCMGFGCNAAGVTGCRIIDSERERLLAILTNTFVPCNGRFPILISLAAAFFVPGARGALQSLCAALCVTVLVVMGVGMTLLVTRLLSETLLRGRPSSFTLELPPYRRPQVGRVLVRSVLDRTLFVLGRAALVAAPAGLVLWVLANALPGALPWLAGLLQPLARRMGLDGETLLAFALGLPANEIVLPILLMLYSGGGVLPEAGSLAPLIAHGWTAATALCAAVFALFHWPCSTTLLTIKKETGKWRWAALAAALPTAVGVVLCMIIAAI
ncbi:MAG: ferrous iron transporter B [Oscillospiraceae bacterium]|nr:ferrous iron transporter B [Oscillospiraceae bacterium]